MLMGTVIELLLWWWRHNKNSDILVSAMKTKTEIETLIKTTTKVQ